LGVLVSPWGHGNAYVIGACSRCGGAVTLPCAWWSVELPRPTCEQCGAVARASGPVIPMVGPGRTDTSDDVGFAAGAGRFDEEWFRHG
jgi:hypothetical protein